MQPTPPPPPPAPPDLPALPTPIVPGTPVAVELEGAPYVFTVPATAEQVQGLRVRREELQDQLESAREQRTELGEQLRGVPGELRPGIERQLQVIDERIVQLERDLTTTGRLLTAASPELLAQTAEAQARAEARPAGNDEDEMLVGGFAGGVLLMLLVGSVRRRFRRRAEARRPATAATAAAGDDPRMDQLTQAVDAIAVEVERISEGQRFVTQLLAEGRDPRQVAPAPTLGAFPERR